jgi:shikimate kinase
MRRIIITGFMGAGKTTVARALARRLNCRMADLDLLVADLEKRSIPDIIRNDGEEQFRASETVALRLALKRKTASVVALGGGAWTLERNRALIAEHQCLTIWLDASFELCWKRITSSSLARPLALNRQAARRLYRERLPLYELAALHVRMTDDKSVDEIVSEIVDKLRDDAS